MAERVRRTAAVFAAACLRATRTRRWTRTRDLWAAARAGAWSAPGLHAGARTDARDDFRADGSGLGGHRGPWTPAGPPRPRCRPGGHRRSEGTPLISGAFWGPPLAGPPRRGADLEARGGDDTSAVDLARWPWGEERRGSRASAGSSSSTSTSTPWRAAYAARPRCSTRLRAQRPDPDTSARSPAPGGPRDLRARPGFSGTSWACSCSMSRCSPSRRMGSARTSTPSCLPGAHRSFPDRDVPGDHAAHRADLLQAEHVLDLVDPVVLAYYGVFFLFGAAVRGIDPDTRSLTRGWPVMLAVAIVIFLTAERRGERQGRPVRSSSRP